MPSLLRLAVTATAALLAVPAVAAAAPPPNDNYLASKLTRLVQCQNASPGSEDVVLPTVRKNHSYTVQVGGAGNTGGPLKLDLSYFRDRDGDGVLDEEPDKCISRPGIRRFGGCPPEL